MKTGTGGLLSAGVAVCHVHRYVYRTEFGCPKCPKEPPPTNACGFQTAYQPACRSERLPFHSACVVHVREKCCQCGGQAVRECLSGGRFICGAPLCATCDGYTPRFGYHQHPKKESSRWWHFCKRRGGGVRLFNVSRCSLFRKWCRR